MPEAIAGNRGRSIGLILLLALLVGAAGYFLAFALDSEAGILGAIVGLVIAAGIAAMTWFGGDQVILRSSGARPLGANEESELHDTVIELAYSAAIPVPALWIIDSPALNAFATGRSPSTASIAVTRGLIDNLDGPELRGVLAHEMGHIKNRDTAFMTIAAAMLGALAALAEGARIMQYVPQRQTAYRKQNNQWIIFLLAAVLLLIAIPLSRLLYFMASRQREFLADATSAYLTGFPDGLARALQRIEGSSLRLMVNEPAAALCIVNPRAQNLTGEGLAGMFSTHPPTAQRIAVLRAMRDSSFASYEHAYQSISGKSVLPPSVRTATDELPPASRKIERERPTDASPATEKRRRIGR